MVSRTLGSAVLVLALGAGTSATAAPAARAATGGLLGDLGQVAQVEGFIVTAIQDFAHFSGATPASLTEIQQIQALIVHTQDAIIQEINATQVSDLQGKCDASAQNLQNITNPKFAAQIPQYVTDADTCVTIAARQLINATPNTDPHALDEYGLALNVGAAQAMTISAYAGASTGIIQQDIIAGDEALLAKLAPTCGTTPNDDAATVEKKFFDAQGVIPGDDGSITEPGHNACYDYSVTPPSFTDGHLLFFPTGPGTGAEPWNVTGDGEPEISGGVFTSGAHINWPPQSDFAIAQDQAMAATTWPIAKTMLGQLLPDAAPFQSQVSLIPPLDGALTTTPVPAFKVDAAGILERATIDPADNRSDVSFSGWSRDTTPGAPTLRSVASVANADGRYQVFALDRVGRLYTQWEQNPRDDTSWSPWDQMTGPDGTLDGGLSSVTAARNQNGALQIFVNTDNGAIFTRTIVLDGDIADADKPQNATPPAIDDWGPWQQMDGLTVSLAAVTIPFGVIELYGVNSAGQLFSRQETNVNDSDFSVSGNWGPFTQITTPGNGNVALKTVAAAVNLGGGPTVLATDGSNRLWHWELGKQWEQVSGSVQYTAAAKGGGGSGEDYTILQDPNGALTLSAGDGVFGDGWNNQFCTLDVQRTCNINEAPQTVYESGAKTFATLTSKDSKISDSGLATAPGSSPSISTDEVGTTTVSAFVGSDGLLYLRDLDHSVIKPGGGVQVAPGTSPALANVGGDTWEIVYERPGGQLAAVDSSGTVTPLNGVAAPGSNPSIVAVQSKREFDPAAGFWVAFQNAADHMVWTISPENVAARAGAGYVMTAGTSPSITTDFMVDWEIAFNQSGGTLATIGNTGAYTGSIAAIGGTSSPSIAYLRGSASGVPQGYIIAFRGTDGTVWTSTAQATRSLGSGVRFTVTDGTNPAIGADVIGDWEVAIHGPSNDLETVASAGDLLSTGSNSIAAGTSPAISVPVR